MEPVSISLIVINSIFLVGNIATFFWRYNNRNCDCCGKSRKKLLHDVKMKPYERDTSYVNYMT
jgi:hypothetical protein